MELLPTGGGTALAGKWGNLRNGCYVRARAPGSGFWAGLRLDALCPRRVSRAAHTVQYSGAGGAVRRCARLNPRVPPCEESSLFVSQVTGNLMAADEGTCVSSPPSCGRCWRPPGVSLNIRPVRYLSNGLHEELVARATTLGVRGHKRAACCRARPGAAALARFSVRAGTREPMIAGSLVCGRS